MSCKEWNSIPEPKFNPDGSLAVRRANVTAFDPSNPIEVSSWDHNYSSLTGWRPHLETVRFKLNDPVALSSLIIGWLPTEVTLPTTFAALSATNELIPLELEITTSINMLLFKEDFNEGAFPLDDEQSYNLVFGFGAAATEAATFMQQVNFRPAIIRKPC